MSDRRVQVGVSPRTFDVLSGRLSPSVHLLSLVAEDSGIGKVYPNVAADAVEIVWRRQTDRTAWLTCVLDKLPALRWIHTDTAGVDRMPLGRLAREQIQLTNARGAHTPAVAEWALGAMFMVSKDLPRTVMHAAEHRWVPHERDVLLQGRTVLVLGLGHIGRYLADLCSALGMRVFGVSRSGNPVAGVQHVVSSSGNWRELLPQVSFLINCLPLTVETEAMVDISVLSRLSSPAFLINVGRGETVVEADVLAALRSGPLRSAVLDAVRSEPLPANSELWGCPDIVVSPHASGFTDATEARTRQVFLAELDRYLRGEPLINLIDLERGY